MKTLRALVLVALFFSLGLDRVCGESASGSKIRRMGDSVGTSKGDGEAKSQNPSSPGKSIELAIELNDGSRVVGESMMDSIGLQTSFASIETPLSQVSSISFKDDHSTVTVTFQNGDKLQGTLKLKAFKLKAAFGPVTISTENISQISFGIRAEGSVKGREFRSEDDALSIPGNCFLEACKTHERIDRFPQPMRSCTWMFWIRSRQTTPGSILAKALPDSVRHFYANINDLSPDRPGKFTWVERSRNGDFKWAVRENVTDGRWHHIALIRDFEVHTLAFCVDGEIEPGVTHSGMWEISNDEPLLIGIDYSSTYRFQGDLRDLRYYTSPLTRDEVHRAMEGQLSEKDCFVVRLGNQVTLPSWRAGD
jgi:hypothetical protein